jgi:hypothetical protein
MAMSISVLSGGGGSASFAPSVNGLLQSAGAVSVSGSTAGPCSGVGDYRSAPIPFAAGTILNVGITQSNSMSEAVATLYVRFD